MHIAAHQWSPPRTERPSSDTGGDFCLSLAQDPGQVTQLYKRLNAGETGTAVRAASSEFLAAQLARVEALPSTMPESPEDVEVWMAANAQLVTAKYSIYLEERRAGAPRRFFSNRAHALYFLQAVAPTKVVDGAWLAGLLAHGRNPRFDSLVRTYVEELGEGQADKNHVVLYRRLLARHDLEPGADLGDAFYLQGAVQLALGCNAEDFLPEIVGFNLDYEQLPLHLLITAYELNELGLDPYYFTLHVTVDNTDTGHAKRAVQAVLDTLPRFGDKREYWRRVCNGGKLAGAGIGTGRVIADFDIEREVVRILARKSVAGHGAHSDYCKVAGRSINSWLSDSSQVPAFLAALKEAGWIKPGQPVGESRFWGLLQGEKAEMFGVFSGYEMQVIHDWLRGAASADGKAYGGADDVPVKARQLSFRAAARLAAARVDAPKDIDPAGDGLFDPDVQALQRQLHTLDDAGQFQLLARAMAPAHHWTPVGLYATRLFWARLHG